MPPFSHALICLLGAVTHSCREGWCRLGPCENPTKASRPEGPKPGVLHTLLDTCFWVYFWVSRTPEGPITLHAQNQCRKTGRYRDTTAIQCSHSKLGLPDHLDSPPSGDLGTGEKKVILKHSIGGSQTPLPSPHSTPFFLPTLNQP